MDELNRMCKDCNCLNKNCNGTKEQIWTGCIYKGPLPGQRVKITSGYFKDMEGIYKGLLYTWNDFVIDLDSKGILLFKSSEFEVIQFARFS